MKTASLLFGCCSQIQQNNNLSEQKISFAFMKNTLVKQRKAKIKGLRLPKASLKSISSVKSFQSNTNFTVCHPTNETFNSCKSLKVLPPETEQRKENFGEIRRLLLPISSQNKLKRVQLPIYRPNLTISYPKNQVRFYHENFIDHGQRKKQLLFETKKAENLLKTQDLREGTSFSFGKQLLDVKLSESLHNQSFKIKLGQSKITMQSSGDNQSISDRVCPKMDESSVLLNVFHATDSQIKKWDLDKTKH